MLVLRLVFNQVRTQAINPLLFTRIY